MIILVDIDHTVADAFWRDSMIGTVSWDEYHEESKHDKPFKKIIHLLANLWVVGYKIIGFTGRNEKFRQLTTKWLLNNGVDMDEVLMRPDGNFLKNDELKLMLVEERFKGDYSDIHFVIDDREDTCIAFQKLGITTLQIRNISDEHDNRIRNVGEDSGGSSPDNEGEK